MIDTSIQIESDYFSSHDGSKIFFQMDAPKEPVANILIVHGFGEHCARYDDLTHELVALNYAVFRYDQRGHGRSDGRRGHIFSFDEYLQDFVLFKERALSTSRATCKTFLVGHSYGGLVSFSAALRDASDFQGLILSSPFFGVADDLPQWKVGLGKLLSKYLPTFSLPTNIAPEWLSHDPKTIEQYATDTLMGRTASTRWLTETIKAQENALANASRLNLPLLWQQAGEDKLVCKGAGRRVFDLVQSPDKVWTEYPNFYHEIYFELERKQPISELVRWLDQHLEG